jgi:hypothetical protein
VAASVCSVQFIVQGDASGQRSAQNQRDWQLAAGSEAQRGAEQGTRALDPRPLVFGQQRPLGCAGIGIGGGRGRGGGMGHGPCLYLCLKFKI